MYLDFIVVTIMDQSITRLKCRNLKRLVYLESQTTVL